jgi:nucleoside-diphosphate-sugar epimerase
VAKTTVSRVLVTGATGFIGGRLARRLLADGARVRLLVRPTSSAAELAELGAEVVVGDVTDAASRAEAVEGCEIVHHTASLVTESNPSEAEYLRVNADATEELAGAAARAGVRRFVFVSSTAVYAPNEADVVDEGTPPAPQDAYGRSKLEAERRLERLAGDLGIAIVRPSRVYGPGDRALLPAVRAIARRRFPLVGDGSACVDFLHVDDLVAALEAAAAKGRGTYVVAGPAPVTVRDFFAAFAEALGTRLLPLSLPARPALAASAVLTRAFALVGRESPVTPKKLAFFLNTRRASTTRARRELGWEPRIDVASGARATVVWYRSAGWLR